MAESTGKKARITLHNEGLRKYWTGLLVVSLSITAIGSTMAGASIYEIIWRTGLVTFVLWVVGQVVIRTWSLFEEMKRREAESRRR